VGPYRWNEKALRYADQNGRFVSRLQVRYAIDDALDSAGARMRSATERMREGGMSVGAWHRTMKTEVTNVHLYSAASARGGWAQLSSDDLKRVGDVVGREQAYLDRFARQLGDPNYPRDGRVLMRSEMYSQRGRSTYHLIDKELHLEAGMKEERNLLHSLESCDGCIDETAAQWVPIGELTPIGDRNCLSNCKCTMEYRGGPPATQRPTDSPDSPEYPENLSDSGSRPAPDTQTGKVWTIADDLKRSLGREPTRAEVIKAAVQAGVNPSTASTQYGRWKKFGSVAPPPPPPPPPKPVIPEHLKPKPGTTTRKVWDLAEKLEEDLGRLPTRAEVVARFVQAGGNSSTASTQYSAWNKARAAVRGGTPPPVPTPKPKPAPTPKPEPQPAAMSQQQRDELIERRLATIEQDMQMAQARSLQKIAQLMKEEEAIIAKFGRYTHEARVASAKTAAARQAHRRAALEALHAPNKGTVDMVLPRATTDRTRHFVETQKKGKELFEHVVDKSIYPKPGAPFPKVRAQYSSSRAHYDLKGTIVGSSTPEVVAHELAHWLETQRKDVLDRLIAFRTRRLAPGEQTVSLRSLFPSSRYDPGEITFKDRFGHAYTGKVYRRSTYKWETGRGTYVTEEYATEILSMGIETLLQDPVSFYRNDREFFEFIVRTIWGSSRM
jgi:hypothetical protein